MQHKLIDYLYPEDLPFGQIKKENLVPQDIQVEIEVEHIESIPNPKDELLARALKENLRLKKEIGKLKKAI